MNREIKIVDRLFSIFRAKVTDEYIFKTLGGVARIRNGIGWGFISSAELYDKGHLEVGFGRSTSGYGDWGGGFEYATDSILKIVIDRDHNIIESSTHSFYNSKDSQLAEIPAKKIKDRLGDVLIIENPLLKECVDSIFEMF